MLKDYLLRGKEVVENFLEQVLISPTEEYSELYQSMRYSLLMGGKRIRPILTMMVLDALEVEYTKFMPSICAIELIHTYSLIHDDLPAMDDDMYRRGKLTNHMVYGEGMAVLAGDGLLTNSFQLVCSDTNTTPEQKILIIDALSFNAGPAGMVGGQAYDLRSEGKSLTLDNLVVLHKGKTGALFTAAVSVGLFLGEAGAEEKESLLEYASYLGLLFQITDDILDVTGTVEVLGKNPGSDAEQHKATYVSLLGLEAAQLRAEEAAVAAKKALAKTTINHRNLSDLVDYLIHRTA